MLDPNGIGVAERGGTVQSLERAFELLELIRAAGGRLGLQELAAASRLPKPTVHRLLGTMSQLGYLRRNASRQYILGPTLIGLGESAKGVLGSWARPFLSELAALLGETVNLAVLDGSRAVYVAQIASTKHSLRTFTEVGRHVALHASGVGKMLLAQLDTAETQTVVDRIGLEALTPNTVTTTARLLREIEDIRGRGYAFDDGEFELGVRCIAAAVPGAPVPAAMSVSAPATRLPDAVRDAVAPSVRRIAADFGASLSAQGSARVPRLTVGVPGS